MSEDEKRISVVTGDITKIEADAIVNAANSSLMGGGGVDGAIHRAGGASILAACREIRNSDYPHGLPTGEAVITTAGNLLAKWVIHIGGPVWHGGGEGEREQLAGAYRSSLELAASHKLRSLVFPAISTGVYGFPKDEAARIAWKTVCDFLAQSNLPERVTFIFFSDSDRTTFIDAVRD